MQIILNRIIKYSIYVLVFLLPIFWLPFSFEAFEYSKQYLLFFLVSLGFLAWILKQIVYDKEIKFRKSLIDYLVLGFLLAGIISAVFSVDKNSSILGFYGRFSNGLVGLSSLGMLYFLIINNAAVRSSKLIKLFLWSSGLAVLAGYFSIFGIWQKIGAFFPKVMLQRTFNPVAGSLEGLSVFLAIVMVLLTGLLLSKIRNIFHWVLLLGSLGLLIMVDFKPAWIILSAALALSIAVSLAKRIFKENVNRLLLPIFLIVVAAAFMVWQPFRMNFPREQLLPQSVSWQVGVKSATDSIKNGFLGSGIGTFHYDFARYKPESFNQNWMWQIRFDRAGSYFSELLATMGFLGLLVYLTLAVLTLLISWFFISRQPAEFPLIMVFVALLVSQFVYYQNTSLVFAFWIILALVSAPWQTMTAAFKEKIISFKNFPELSLLLSTLVIIFGVAILSFYFYGVKYYLADMQYARSLLVLGEPRTKNLEKAVNLNPRLAYYRTILARAYLAQTFDEMQKPQAQQDPAKIQLLVARSIDQARIATTLAPNQVANWETLGVIYREIQGVAQGATDWGIKSFEEAIGLEPSNPVLYTELGRLYLASGDKEEAKDNFNKALEKKPDYVTATIQLALLLEKENILDEAVEKLESAVQKDSLNVEARFQLGRLYFNNNKIDQAIEQFQIVVALVPNHSNARYSLGVAYANRGQTQLAIQEFEKVLELNPGNSDIMQKLEKLRGY